MKKFCILLFLFLSFLGVRSQNPARITGKVFDAYTGHPLTDVNIRLSTGEGTTTGSNGEFSLTCPASSEMTVSRLSYETYRVVINGQTTLKIGLIPTSYNLNEVSVSTSRFETNKNLTQPRSISVITPKQVSREDELSFDKVLNLEPGVFSSAVSVPGSFGNGVSGLSSALMIRGYLGDRMAGGAKLYLNGIPLTDAEGKASYSDVDFSVVGQTEIIKGPNSALYGSGIGGVVKMSVLQPKPLSTRISEQFTTGSYGLFRTNTRVESSTNGSSIIANFGHQYYDGWVSHSNSRQDFVTIAGTFRPSDRQSVFVYSSYSAAVGSINKDALDSADFYNKVKPESDDTLSIKDRSTTENYRIGISHNYQFSKHVSNMTSLFTSGTVGSGNSVGERTEFNLTFGNEKISVNGTIGNELQKTTSSSIKYNKLETGENGALNTFEDYTAFQHSLFTEWSVNLPLHFLVTAGASYNFIEFGIVDHLGYTGNPSNKKSNTGFKRFEPVLTPSFSVLKSFQDNYSVFFSYSQGYQPYGMSKTINIPYLGRVNNDLKPERGTQYELGTKGSFLKKRLVYQLALFYLDIADKVTTQSVYKPNGSILYSWYTNSGRQINKGIELSAGYSLVNRPESFVSTVQPFFSLTYSDFTFKDFKSDNNNDKNTVDYDGKKASIPPVLFNLGLDVSIRWGFYLNTTFRYVDKRPGDYANLHYAKAYTTVAATLGYRHTFFNHLSLNVAAVGNNLTNELYYYGGGSSITPIGAAYIPAPYKSTFYGKVNLSYTF
ncbi:MAG TPA: TonB-dependent receptor [Bacteroidales bacterium]|nr:TonB-dependent receptor [Bacteroidales bacterium]HPS62259.1 TonB-dependent receptor [Bacteroidales bacterium]